MQLSLVNAPLRPQVPERDLWRTPAGVWKAPLALLRRDRFDLDAAADDYGGITTPADDHIVFPERDGLLPWPRPARSRHLVPWLCWLNPPFSQACGGKAAWSEHAMAQAAAGWLVAFYCPVYGDTWADVLEATALTTVRIGGGRVHHPPPPGLDSTSPMQTAHRIWVLGPDEYRSIWPHPARMVWDWKRETWIGGVR